MLDRFNPGPLLLATARGLRNRAAIGHETADLVSRSVLWGIPLLLGVASWIWNWQIRKPDQIIAGYALLAGALIAAFAQLASWRSRLTERGRATEGVARRAADEAVAHTLLAVLMAMVAATVMVVLANIMPDPVLGSASSVVPVASRALTAVAVAVGAFLLLTFVVIVNLLWDAYEAANPSSDDTDAKGSDSSA